MVVAVFGRGKSLSRFADFPVRPVFDRIYLVNDCSEEVERIGLAKGDAKRFVHVVGRKGATIMGADTYRELGIARIVSNAIDFEHISNVKRYEGLPRAWVEPRPTRMRKRGYPPIGWKKLMAGKRRAALKSDNGNCWPTTGMFAVDLALTECKPTELWLYGFDLYRSRYLVKPNRPYQTQKNPKIQMMRVCLEGMVNEFPDTKFVSVAKVGLSAKNWIEI